LVLSLFTSYSLISIDSANSSAFFKDKFIIGIIIDFKIKILFLSFVFLNSIPLLERDFIILFNWSITRGIKRIERDSINAILFVLILNIFNGFNILFKPYTNSDSLVVRVINEVYKTNSIIFIIFKNINIISSFKITFITKIPIIK